MNWQDIRDLCVESARTLQKMPKGYGPKRYGSAWPAFPHDKNTAYEIDGSVRVKVLPSAKAIERMEWFWDLVNANLGEADRKAIWTYGRVRTKKYSSIRAHCRKNGLKEHEYRRQNEKIFQKLAEIATGKRGLKYATTVAPEHESGSLASTSDVTCSNEGRTFIRYDTPLSPEAIRLGEDVSRRTIQRLQERMAQRAKERA